MEYLSFYVSNKIVIKQCLIFIMVKEIYRSQREDFTVGVYLYDIENFDMVSYGVLEGYFRVFG